MAGLLVTDVAVGCEQVDVRCADGVITDVAAGLVPRRGETVLRGATAVLPGLHDHHLHLLAMAAVAESVDLRPRGTGVAVDVRHALDAAGTGLPTGEWIRAVGYDERYHGRLDRWVLDRIAPDRPLRVQHRSGHLWVLNSTALCSVGLLDSGGTADCAGQDGIEVDGSGEPTGRLFDRDGWLARRLPRRDPPDLGPVSRRLASYGVTGVTDATPTRTTADLDVLAAARRSGALAQRVRVMGDVEPGKTVPVGLETGPVKVMVADGRVPDLDGIAQKIEAAHRAGRPVALHCVTLAAAAVALAAWDAAGTRVGDRLEHGSVLTPDVVARLAEFGVTVVSEPAFLLDRGDDYLVDVEEDERAHLYRCAGLERAGVALGAGTDAPFGPEDPWIAVASAVKRSTRSGRVIGPDETLDPWRALRLFLTFADDPGGPARTVTVGAAADLCLLGTGLHQTLREPEARQVVATVVGGHVIHER